MNDITYKLVILGAWLAVNGEAIYNTKPWTVQNDTLTENVWYTLSNNQKQLYASILEWPDDNTLLLGSPKLLKNSQIHLLGYSSEIPVSVLLLLPRYVMKIVKNKFVYFSGNNLIMCWK